MKASSRSRNRSIPRISEAEWLVMRAIWQKGPLTTNQVVAEVQPGSSWKAKTIHTLLTRLAAKGAVHVEKQGREHLFRPCVTAEECEHAMVRSFLGRFFGGEIAPFLVRFVEREKLTPQEIARLKRILEGKRS